MMFPRIRLWLLKRRLKRAKKEAVQEAEEHVRQIASVIIMEIPPRD
jgi:hypothetical protein